MNELLTIIKEESIDLFREQKERFLPADQGQTAYIIDPKSLAVLPANYSVEGYGEPKPINQNHQGI